MTWIDRFSFVMRSTITTLREKVEDPERMLHQLVCDMEEELETVRASVAAAMADERQLAGEVESLRTEGRNWEERSTSALRRKDEAAARLALEQRLRCQERLAQLEKSWEQQQSQTGKLRESFRDLEDKIQQARQRRTLLVARLASAESQRTIRGALDRANGKSAFAEFSRLEKKVERAEALSVAYDQLEGRDPDAEALAARFEKEERREKLEAEFAELKGRLMTPASSEPVAKATS